MYKVFCHLNQAPLTTGVQGTWYSAVFQFSHIIIRLSWTRFYQVGVIHSLGNEYWLQFLPSARIERMEKRKRDRRDVNQVNASLLNSKKREEKMVK